MEVARAAASVAASAAEPPSQPSVPNTASYGLPYGRSRHKAFKPKSSLAGGAQDHNLELSIKGLPAKTSWPLGQGARITT